MEEHRNVRIGVFTGIVLYCASVGAFWNGPAVAGEEVLHVFQGDSDGSYPSGALIADAANTLYGTTRGGGAGCQNNEGCGTVFRITPNGSEDVLYAFEAGSDGAAPAAGLLEDGAGDLFGTTESGGTANQGTVFELAVDGTETVLHSFQGGADGSGPETGLVEDEGGNFYGTTGGGGSSNFGTVFEVFSGGGESVVHAFQGGTDGIGPDANLIRDDQGNFYGTTGGGGGGTGCGSVAIGCGTIFKVTPDGTETVVYAFQGGTDGATPGGALIEDGAGNLYGTTWDGGSYGHGTVFKLSSKGVETVLYAFKGGSDGDSPNGLITDKKGNLYGTTNDGGTGCQGGGCGTVFEVTKKGHEKILYKFTSVRGRYPTAALLLGQNGELYGTTFEGGGKPNLGVVFEVKK